MLSIKHRNSLTDVKETTYMPTHVIKCFAGSGQDAEHTVESSNDRVYKLDLYTMTETQHFNFFKTLKTEFIPGLSSLTSVRKGSNKLSLPSFLL